MSRSTEPASDSFLEDFAATRGFLLGRPGRFHIDSDPQGGARVLFLRSGPRSPDLGLFEMNAATGETRELVTPAALLQGGVEELSDAEKARRERMRVTERGFTSFGVSPDGRWILLTLSGRLFLFDRRSGGAQELPTGPANARPAPIIDPRFSPDGTRIAFVRGADLWCIEGLPGLGDPRGTGELRPTVRALTEGGHDDLTYGLAEFVAQEEMARFEGHWFSPGGRHILCAEVDQRGVEHFSISDPAHPEKSPVVFAYPRPGKANAHVRLLLLALDEPGLPGSLAVSWDAVRWPYLARVLWTPGPGGLAILVQTRDQRQAQLLSVDVLTGQTHAVITEEDTDWVNLDRDLPRFSPDGASVFWATERGGARAVELRGIPAGDGATAQVNTVIPADCGFISLAHVSPDGRTGIALLGDQVRCRIVQISLDGHARVVPITRDAAEHSVVVSADGQWLVDTRTSADLLPESRLLRVDGTVAGMIPGVAETPSRRVALELTTAGPHNAAIIRPRDFDPARKYRVLVHVYGGPHALMVKADERAFLLDQWMADQGAVVVAFDNRGTPRRGRTWERTIKNDFATVPLDDQVAALQDLAERHSFLDLDRVGIFGWSFGGYMAALAVLRRPDVFKAAAAGAPVVDWHDYDTHYTERYLDLPQVNPAGYVKSNLLTYARDLQRPLLLIHGTADDNVYFFHSLKLADALFRAGKDFDFLPLAGFTHQVPEPQARTRLQQRIARYLLSKI